MFVVQRYDLKDYICLPKGVWNKIKVDFSSKYNPSNPAVKLDKIAIGVKKRIEPTVVKCGNCFFAYYLLKYTIICDIMYQLL